MDGRRGLITVDGHRRPRLYRGVIVPEDHCGSNIPGVNWPARAKRGQRPLRKACERQRAPIGPTHRSASRRSGAGSRRDGQARCCPVFGGVFRAGRFWTSWACRWVFPERPGSSVDRLDVRCGNVLRGAVRAVRIGGVARYVFVAQKLWPEGGHPASELPPARSVRPWRGHGNRPRSGRTGSCRSG
jgi:hypothetical protein